MNPNYLYFQQPIADLEAKIQELRTASACPSVNVDTEVRALENNLRLRTAQIFRNLS
ncbi:acetyl-CoA carboxylase carboxyl transferase subunit alpha, partial [Xylella fastidiosa subsp. multiplex]|nr:acetyl-CoA carboxylase carboxyl transferase subunit alpha [Xylella fastidiosa subsp. multiplex]